LGAQHKCHRWRGLLAALAALTAAACNTVDTTEVDRQSIPPSLEASPAELVELFNRQAAAVRSLNARVELNPVAGSAYSGVIQDYRDVRGFLLAQRPASIRMIGQAPVVASTIFDMVSDGETFRVSIPPKHKFIVGPARFERPAAKPIENLRPHHLVDAVFWTELPGHAELLFEEFEAEPASATRPGARYYILTESRPTSSAPLQAPRQIYRKVWFDRASLGIARVQVFGPAGKIETDARYGDWQPVSSSPAPASSTSSPSLASFSFPRLISVARPRDDYRLEIRISRLTVNEPIAAERFTLDQPPGAELIRIEEKM